MRIQSLVICMKQSLQFDILFIRFSYWLGAIMDLLVALSMTLYIFFEVNIGMNYPPLTPETRFMLIAGMALMWGWTVLLIWGDSKPLERRVILLFTAFPVVFGLFIGELVLYLQGYTNHTVVQFSIFQTIRFVLFSIFCISFFFARKKAISMQQGI